MYLGDVFRLIEISLLGNATCIGPWDGIQCS